MRKLILILLFAYSITGFCQELTNDPKTGISIDHPPQVFKGGVVYQANSNSYVWSKFSDSLFAYMDTIPHDTVKLAIDQLFKSVNDSTWSKLDFFHLEALNTRANSLLNIVKPGTYDLTVTGNPNWTKYLGYKGDGNDRLATGYTIDGNGKYKLDSASIGVYIMDNVEASVSDIGGNSTNDTYIRTRYETNNALFRLNDATNMVELGNIKTSQGFYIGNRPGVNKKMLFKNGYRLTLSQANFASVAVPNYQCYILSDGSSYSTKRVGADFLGAGLTDTEVRQISDAVNGYMKVINAEAYNDSTDIILIGDKTAYDDKDLSNPVDRAINNQYPKYILGTGDYATVNVTAGYRLYLHKTTIGINRMFSATGNHDRDGDSTVFADQFRSAFNTDSTYFSRKIENAEFFFVDNYISAQEDSMLTMVGASEKDSAYWASGKQGQWLINALSSSTAKWKILVYHQPTWISPGTPPYLTTGLNWDWKALGVDVIINGHVHWYERLTVNTGSGNIPIINLGVSGAGQLSPTSISDDSEIVLNGTIDADFSAGMFVKLTVSTNSLVFNLHAVKTDGTIVADKDTLTITK